MANSKKCSQINCPFTRVVSDDCNFVDCPYRTEAIDPQEVIGNLCNYIADLIVQKLKDTKDESNNTAANVPHTCGYCKYSKIPVHAEPCYSCSMKAIDRTNVIRANVIDNFEPREVIDESNSNDTRR